MSTRQTTGVVRIRALAALLLAGAALLAPAVASAQQHGADGQGSSSDPAARLGRLAERVSDLTGHFAQMQRTVEGNPELEREAGWASPATMHWAVVTGGLVGALSMQAETLARHVEETRSGDITSRPGMTARLDRLRAQLDSLTNVLEEMGRELDGMRAVVHGEDHDSAH